MNTGNYENFLIRDMTPQVPESQWCSECERHVEDCVCEELCDHFRETVGSTGDGDVCVPAPSPVPLQLDYPAWRLSFSAYGEHLGLEVPEAKVWGGQLLGWTTQKEIDALEESIKTDW